MAEIIGLEALNRRLGTLQVQAVKGQGSVATGYRGTAYAVYVHENVEMKLKGQPRPSGRGRYWDPPGAGPKFLENPAKELNNSGELGRIVVGIYKKTGLLVEALLAGGMRIQAESQRRVPVEYSILKNSAFTEKE